MFYIRWWMRWGMQEVIIKTLFVLHNNRKFWRYQKGYSEAQWKKNRQCNSQEKKDKRTKWKWFTKHYREDKRVSTSNPTKNRGEFRCSERVSSSCSTSGIRRVTLFRTPMISHEWGKNQLVITTSGTYPWSFMTQTFLKC